MMASPSRSSSSPPPPPTTTTQLLALPPPTTTPTTTPTPPPTTTPTTTITTTITPIPISSSLSSSSSAKKTPPLPWTHQETVNLIQSYQDKWYSLKRGQLKASQWEEVSITVAARCAFDEPTKTSTQCRHKMEKLRKRYRAERLKPYPNSWQYFQLMDNMERGPFPLLAVAQPVNMQPNHQFSNEDSDSDAYDDGTHRSKSKSINNIVRAGGGVGVVFSGNSSQNVNGSSVYGRRIQQRVVGNERGMMAKGVREAAMSNSRKRMGYYEDSDDEEDDEEDQEVDVDGEGDDDGGDGDGGKELAAEIRGFAERFMRVEKMKIEMMRETERHRMEMEKRRMEMIIDSQRKIVDSIGRAFRAHKKLNTGQEL